MGEIKRKLLVVVFVFTAISSGVWFFLTKKSPLFPGETIHTGSTLARVAAAEDTFRGQSDQAALSSFNFEPITSPLFQLPPGSVTSVEILDHTIEAEDIDGNSITSRTIRDDTILGRDIYRHAALDIASLTLAEGISVGGDASVTGDLTVSGDITARGTLDLVGNLGIRSLAYTWPSAHDNGVLSNDGAGQLTWQTLGAASITADSLDFSEFKDALALDASTDILVDGTEVFSLTNTGTGSSFLVNDVASDTTPFVIDASGNVGIGTITPSQKLEVNGDVKIGNAVLSGTGTDNFEINALINSIEIGTSRNTIGGGGSTVAPNIIGTTSLPFYNDFTPTDWAADTSYVAQSANVALIAGGYDNIVNQEAGVIVGGGHNFMKYNSNGHSIIGGGSYNLISAGRSGIVSGRRNTITGASEVFSFIGGGDDNNIIGSYSAILGGRDIDITGDYSSAFGRRAKVTADGSVAFSDSTDSDFTVSTANQFGARYSGGYTLTGGRFQITDDLASDGTLAQFYDLTSDGALDIRSNTGGSGLAAKHIDLVGISSVSDLAFSPSSDTRRALVIKDGGNVGIGTTAPSWKLTVTNTSGASDVSVIDSTGNGVQLTASAGSGYLTTNSANPLIFRTNSAEVMRLTSGGNVGIGTGSPTAKLDISTGNLNLDNTTNANQYGVISKGGTRFIHNFNYGNNGTVTTEGYNVFVGQDVGNLTMGSTATQTYHASYNTAVGYRSLYSNTTGYNNSAQGYVSLYSNTTGYNNSAQGAYSLQFNTTGYNNSALGTYSLYLNATGSNNSAQGYASLYNNTTGYNNSAQGHASLYSNTTGYNNSAQGYVSLYSNTTGSNNSAQGFASLYLNATGSNNSAQGYASLYNNTTGSNNSALGTSAGRYIADGATGRTTGNNGLYLGYNSKASADGTDNEIAIGYNAIGAGSNSVVLGNTSVTKTLLNGNVGIGTTSPGIYNLLVSDPTDDAFIALDTADGTGNQYMYFLDGGIQEWHMGRVESDNRFSLVESGIGERLTILSGGNVGIGTTSPAYKLDIQGTSSTLYDPSSSTTRSPVGTLFDVYNTSATTGAYSGLSLMAVSGGAVVQHGWIGAVSASGGYAPNIVFGRGSGSTSHAESMRIDASGNVGIGTTTPGRSLEIAKGGGVYLRLRDSNGSSYWDIGSSYNYSDNDLVFLSGAAERFRVNSSGKFCIGYDGAGGCGGNGSGLIVNGNVGIGTTSPNDKLDISGTLPIIRLTDTDGGWSRISGNSGMVALSADESNVVANSRIELSIDGSEKARITSTGNVGIGTTSPSYNLDVVGNIRATNYVYSNVSTITPQVLNSGPSDMQIYQSGAYSIGLWTNSAERMRVDSTGNVGIGTTTPDEKLSVKLSDAAFVDTYLSGNAWGIRLEGSSNADVATFQADGGTGEVRIGGVYSTYFPTFYAGNSEAMRITTTGNVGIGDTSPDALLTVGSGDLFQVSSAGNVSTVGQINGTDGLVTKVNSGTCDDSVFTLDTDGNLCVDSTNGRLYYRYGGSWHYSAQTAGFQIPNYEVYAYDFADRTFDTTRPLAENDFLIPFVENFMEDGAAHGLYAKFSDVKDALFYTEQQQISTLSLQTSQHITTLAELRVAVDDQLTVIGDSLAQYEETIEQQGDRLDVLDNDIVTLRDVVDIQDELLGRLVHDIESTVSQTALFTSQIATLTEQVAALTDFYITFDLGSLGSLVIRDDDGNVDLLDGKLKARILETGLLTIEADDPEGATIGRDKIESGEKVVTVKTTAVKTGSHIIITPRTLTAEPLAVTAVTDGEDFTVERITPATEDISFDWWIVEGE